MAASMFLVILFILVLLILLVVKAPKVGAGVIAVIVAVFIAGLVFLVPVSMNRRVSYESPTEGRGQAVTAPIWSEGVENEYKADVYPSRLVAARALGLLSAASIHKVIGDPNGSIELILFQESYDRGLVAEFERAIEEKAPGMQCSVEADLRNIDPGEVGVTFDLTEPPRLQILGADEGSNRHRTEGLTIIAPAITGGRIVATAFTEGKRTSAEVSFFLKLWVEDFAGFANKRPDGQFVVARSREACTSENEAKSQALRDACDQVAALVDQKWPTVPGQPPLTVSSTDLLEGGFIVDQFVQSFDGMSGRFWREAMLIDTSAEKLAWLGSRKTAEVHVVRTTWAHMILSALGVLVVIVATYLFLNMATRGYYVWSLRIAGTVLAIMGIISILLVLK